MMPLTLTLTDDHPKFGAVIALLAGSSVGAVAASSVASPIPPMPAAGGGDDDADDTGPVNAAAPAADANGLPWDARIHSETKAMTDKGVWRKRRGVDSATVATVEAELRANGAPAMPAPMPQPIPAPAPMPMPAPLPAVSAAPAPLAVPGGAPSAPAPVATVPMPAPIAPAPMPAPVGMASGPAVAAPVADPVPPMPAPAPVAQPMPAPAPAPAPEPLQTAVAVASGTLDFAQFMQHLSGQMQKRDGAGAPLVHADYLASLTAEIAGAFGVQLGAITDIAANPNMITFAMQAMQRDQRW